MGGFKSRCHHTLERLASVVARDGVGTVEVIAGTEEAVRKRASSDMQFRHIPVPNAVSRANIERGNPALTMISVWLYEQNAAGSPRFDTLAGD